MICKRCDEGDILQKMDLALTLQSVTTTRSGDAPARDESIRVGGGVFVLGRKCGACGYTVVSRAVYPNQVDVVRQYVREVNAAEDEPYTPHDKDFRPEEWRLYIDNMIP